jgi:hypothetical protein
MGACSKTARKVVFAFSLAESSDHGNWAAVFMLPLSLGTIRGRKPTMGYPLPWCSRFGSDDCKIAITPPAFDFNIRRANLVLRRADVTSKQENAVENSGVAFLSARYSRTIKRL